jgi:transposase-like protein
MLAAIYLHWDGSYATYHIFFSHLQSKLGTDIGGMQSQIVIGSDKEAALTKAIKQCFPSSVQLLCTRHLQENVQQYLSSKAGANENILKNHQRYFWKRQPNCLQ